MSALQSLEKKLDDLFVKNAPALPAGAKKTIVAWLPWINLILGVLTLLAAYGLYNAARTIDSLVNSVNTFARVYGAETASHLSTLVWLGIAFLAVEALLYIAAFPATRDRKKSGWNLMFYALLVNVVYGVVVTFSDFGGAGKLVSSLVGSAIGGYLLFQIRASYLGAPSHTVRKD